MLIKLLESLLQTALCNNLEHGSVLKAN